MTEKGTNWRAACSLMLQARMAAAVKRGFQPIAIGLSATPTIDDPCMIAQIAIFEEIDALRGRRRAAGCGKPREARNEQ